MFNIFINFSLLHIIHLPFFKTQCPLVSLKDKGHPVKFRTS